MTNPKRTSQSDEKTAADGITPLDDLHSVSATAGDLYVDPVAEKRVILKLDLYLAPLITIIFLAAYLDRANIGNAASAGMTKDLNLTSGQLGSKLHTFR